MEDLTVTTSAVLSFSQRLEDNFSSFYEELAGTYAENKETFLSFAKESRKNKLLIIRTYQETVTDALETTFSFKGLNLDNYIVETTIAKNTTYADALASAIKFEEKASKFYLIVAELSKSLLATIPVAFRMVAENRKNHVLKLTSLLNTLNMAKVGRARLCDELE